MATNTTKLGIGAVLLVVCSVIIVTQGFANVPLIAGSAAILGLAAGALLVGTSEDGRPV